MPVNPYLVSALELGYDNYPDREPSENHLEGFTYLKRITSRGYLYHEDTETYTSKTLPPLHYFYQPHAWKEEVESVSTENVYNAPVGIDFENYQWIDLFSEGLSGILTEKNNTWYYKQNLGGGMFSPALAVSEKPSFSGLETGMLQIHDLEGVGDSYLVNYSQAPKGFFRLDDYKGWQNFQAFSEVLNRDLQSDPMVRFIDLNGDGLPDIFISEHDFYEWHESLGEKGFGPANFISQPIDEEQGPKLVFQDIEQTIFLADMSGDGLTDLVRIRNGEVCYWANLGYGRFSRKISMDYAPRFDQEDAFHSGYIKLVDIDGSGTTDIVYLGKNDFRVWLNLNGNSWTTQPKVISGFPAIDHLSDVSVLDLMGTGTSCIVWSSPLPANSETPLRYIDLMDSKKPHLLYFYENNMGKEVRFDYLPSTHYYLEDKKAGKPWATKLPFPVHVVARVTSEDKIRETIFTSTYSYHHGYFDGKEREFRGFGRVETLDTEEFTSFSLNEASNVVEEELHQPPVRTVSWYHTGAAIQKQFLTEIYADEYYQNEAFDEYELPPSVMPEGLSDQEWSEALRACKGLSLRSEVYADDGTEKAPHPYTTSQGTYEIRLVQKKGGNKYASFQVVPLENISYSYDRNPADPRISHSIVLKMDDKGIVTQSASVAYPRIARPANLPDSVWAGQNKRHVAYSEIELTNDIETDDIYLIRTPYESRGYELIGIPGNASDWLTKDILLEHINHAEEIPFEEDGDESLQKRLISHSRMYFLRNNLSDSLPLGQRESLGLGFRSYQLAMTPGLVGRHYGTKVTEPMLLQAGYEHSEGDTNWWIPSGTTIYPADASVRFYAPSGNRDALGTESYFSYDSYKLLIESTTDAIGNTASAVNDYRTLSPYLLTDLNLNRSVVQTDELGMVIASAIMGKEGQSEGDTIDDPTARIEYDLFNWMNHQKPNFVHSSAREQHGPANPRWQESFTYSDGGGATIMAKTQAEPGLAYHWNPETQTLEEIFTSTRWIGNGRTIIDNKGNPIKQYEPYFSANHEYESEAELVETGVTPLLFYDPIGRNIRTEFPNGTFTKVEFDSWHSRLFDLNDTIVDSQWYIERGSPDPLGAEPSNQEQRAAWLAARHYDTSSIIHTDSLGRAIYTIADYGGGKTTSSRSETDLLGRFARIYDQLDREVASGYINMIGTPIYGMSAEKGEKWTFQDVLGRMVRTWDNDVREFYTTYDTVHRPLSAFVRENGEDIAFTHIVYGETHPNSQNLNLRGLAYQVYDQAGVMQVNEVDFKGNALSVQRRLARDYQNTINWQILDGLNNLADIQAAANPLLETETFHSSTSFDALNRPIESSLPDGTIMRPVYNEANILESLSARIMGNGPFINFLTGQEHNARGQQTEVRFGNGTLTRFFYDPKTFQLTNLLTLRSSGDPPTASVQNLHYTYDPVGNITYHRDDAQQTHFFQNNVVRPESFFEYDAVYQLIRATGREHAGIGNNNQRNYLDLPFLTQLPHNNNASAVRTYTQTYQYDDLGNILEMRHQSSDGNGNWIRRYQYAYQNDPTNRTNRLSATSRPGDPVAGPYSETYSYDIFGNITQMPHLQELAWNFQDQCRRINLGGGGQAYYVYGSGGMRMRKIIERNDGLIQERIYLGPVEIYREYRGNNPPDLERYTVSVMGIAQVDTKTIDINNSDGINPLGIPLIRYRYKNHLGSCTLELDETGQVISYEEFHPYGTSAYRVSRPDVDLSLKRYRFSGKERDSETGLDYFGYRYYASWLGRWTSSDPAGFVDGLNLYKYSQNNPVNYKDNSGLDSGRTRDVTTITSDAIARARAQNTDAARAIIDQAYPIGAVVEGKAGSYRVVAGSRWDPNASGDNGANILTVEAITNVQSPNATESSPEDGGNLGGGNSPSESGNDMGGSPGNSSPGGGREGQAGSGDQTNPPTTPGSSTSGEGAIDNADLARLGSAASNYLSAEFEISQIVRALDNVNKARIGRDAAAAIDSLSDAARTEQALERIARNAFNARNASRSASQARQLPIGRTISKVLDSKIWRAITGNSRSWEGLLAKRLAQNEGNLARAYEAIARGSGSGRASATRMAKAGGTLGRVFGAVGIGLSGYALYEDIRTENYGTILGDVAGIGAGAFALAGAATNPVGIALTGVALANTGGDIVGSWVEESTGSRAAGVAAGTVTGMATGAAFGALVGSIVPGIGTAVGAGVGAVIGGVAGFVGAYW
ncbi:MAG: toxin [Bacteroidetes bacterium]|nr:toxin [Bacteroidota bacterium]